MSKKDKAMPVSPVGAVSASGVRLGSKTTVAELLRLLGELTDLSSPALSDIPNPLGESRVAVLADRFEVIGEVGTAKLLRGMIVHQHLTVPAKGGKRVKDLLEAIKTALQMDFEIAKSMGKRALP